MGDSAPEIDHLKPIKFEKDKGKVVKMRLDRSMQSPLDDVPVYHSRLWIQEEGEDPRVIIEDLMLGSKQIVYPCVYASRPACDIREHVRIRDVRPAWHGAAKMRGFEDESIERLKEYVDQDENSATEKTDLPGKVFRMLARLWALPGSTESVVDPFNGSLPPNLVSQRLHP